jgi:hypothetical protein
VGYIEQSLGRNETLLYKARFHWLYCAAAWAVLILIIIFVIGSSSMPRHGLSGSC